MKLYFSAGAYSLAPHIAFREVGVPIELIRVDIDRKVTGNGEDFTRLNPMGYVPLLELDDGSTLRETPAILQFVTERYPNSIFSASLAGESRLRLSEWLHFLSSEIRHAVRSTARLDSVEKRRNSSLWPEKRLAWIELQLTMHPYLLRTGYSVADIYLWVMTNGFEFNSIESASSTAQYTFPALSRWRKIIATRDAVQKAIFAEKLQAQTIVRSIASG